MTGSKQIPQTARTTAAKPPSELTAAMAVTINGLLMAAIIAAEISPMGWASLPPAPTPARKQRAKTDPAKAPAVNEDLIPAALFKPRGGLPNVMAKLQAGQPVTVAYLGGSITAADGGWRSLSLAWLSETFPTAKLTECHAAIGGTGSDLGAYRLAGDVLAHKPDLLFVEFAVNDAGTPPRRILPALEGIVRQTRQANARTDICLVYTFAVGQQRELDRGLCPRSASAHERVADHYGLASVNFALRVAELARAGRLVPQQREGSPPPGQIVFSRDGVHPLKAGHEVYHAALVEALAPLTIQPARPGDHRLPAPLDPDPWIDARMVPLRAEMLDTCWKALPPTDGLAKRFANRLGTIHKAERPGARLTFTFRGTAAMLYDIVGPDGGQLIITVNGSVQAGLRPRFDKYCSGFRISSVGLVEGLPDGQHTITVELAADPPDRSIVTDVEKSKPGFDPTKYQGTVLRVGALLLRGELANEPAKSR